jgi:hypothetical protein
MKVQILVPDITKLATKTRYDEGGLVTTLQFEAKIPPSSIARILNLVRQGVPLMATIESPQAHMDLAINDHPFAEETETQVDVFKLA